MTIGIIRRRSNFYKKTAPQANVVRLEKKRRITPDRKIASTLPLNMHQSELRSSAGFKDAVRTRERRLASRVTSILKFMTSIDAIARQVEKDLVLLPLIQCFRRLSANSRKRKVWI